MKTPKRTSKTRTETKPKKVYGFGPAWRDIDVFGKTSPKDASVTAYRTRAKALRDKYGIAFNFPLTGKMTPQRKGAITRKALALTEFLNPKNGYVFVRPGAKTLKAVRKAGTVSSKQITGKGVFIPTPKTGQLGGGSRKKSRVRIDKTGTVSVTTGKFTSVFRLFRSSDVVKDPAIIEREGKKLGAEASFISIKGHRGGSRKNGYSLKNFMRYLSTNLLPDVEDAIEDDDAENVFRNRLGVEFLVYNWPKRSRKRKPKRK